MVMRTDSSQDAFQQLLSQYGGGGGVTMPGTYSTSSTGSRDSLYQATEDNANVPIYWGDTDYKDTPAPFWPANQRPTDQKSFLESQKEFYNFNPDELLTIQAALYTRGFIKKKKWDGLGDRWDDDSFSAWRKALLKAGQSGNTIWTVLGGKNRGSFFDKDNAQSMVSKAVAKLTSEYNGGGRQRAPLQIRYSNPDDLKAVATKAAQDTIGYVPDETFLDSFVKVYQGMEGGAQRKAYGGGNFTEPGDPGVQAEKMTRQKKKVEAQGYDIVRQFDALLGILGAER
jgi:hypothetical protein